MISSADMFNYAVGVLAVVSTMSSAVFFYCSYLPGAQIKVLDALLQDTWNIYKDAEINGALPLEPELSELRSFLAKLEDSARGIRQQAYHATSFTDENKTMWKGLSRRIGGQKRLVRRFRSRLITASEECRREILQSLENATVDAAEHAPVPSHNLTSSQDTVAYDTQQDLQVASSQSQQKQQSFRPYFSLEEPYYASPLSRESTLVGIDQQTPSHIQPSFKLLWASKNTNSEHYIDNTPQALVDSEARPLFPCSNAPTLTKKPSRWISLKKILTKIKSPSYYARRLASEGVPTDATTAVATADISTLPV
ncbi:hypothetical protein BDQ17DRAFT_1409906 [Cyathus striatus]|nr:hypothetical protein BDQ17DRAFT_1409906 [Cyathus striatus]